MPRYTVIVHERTHTCPNNPDPHPVDTIRTVTGVDLIGPCVTPVRVRCGTTVVQVACGRRWPDSRQCAHCRTTIVVAARTIEHLGHDGPPSACRAAA